jgi:hypothetical protein
MQLKYRAYIDGEFHYFTLEELAKTARSDIHNKSYWPIIDFLEQGNRPDVFTGYQDENEIDIYQNDILYFTIFDCFDTDTQYIGFVIFFENQFGIQVGTEKNFSFYNLYHTIQQDDCIKIIGTTHQNEGLLK